MNKKPSLEETASWLNDVFKSFKVSVRSSMISPEYRDGSADAKEVRYDNSKKRLVIRFIANRDDQWMYINLKELNESKIFYFPAGENKARIELGFLSHYFMTSTVTSSAMPKFEKRLLFYFQYPPIANGEDYAKKVIEAFKHAANLERVGNIKNLF